MELDSVQASWNWSTTFCHSMMRPCTQVTAELCATEGTLCNACYMYLLCSFPHHSICLNCERLRFLQGFMVCCRVAASSSSPHHQQWLHGRRRSFVMKSKKILRCSTRKNKILLQSASTLIASLVYKTGRIVLQSFLVAASLSRTFQTRRYLNLPSIPPNLPICLEPSTSSNRPKTFGTVQYLQNSPETSLCGTAACPSPTVETQYGHRPLH